MAINLLVSAILDLVRSLEIAKSMRHACGTALLT